MGDRFARYPGQLSLAIPSCMGAMSTDNGLCHRWGRNSEFCVTVGPVTTPSRKSSYFETNKFEPMRIDSNCTWRTALYTNWRSCREALRSRCHSAAIHAIKGRRALIFYEHSKLMQSCWDRINRLHLVLTSRPLQATDVFLYRTLSQSLK